MRELLTSLLLAISFSSSAFALECTDIYGIWHGNLGNLSAVSLYIHSPDPMEDAEISFTNNARNTYGLLRGTCKKNNDGTLSLDLTRNSYGVRVNLNSRLMSASQLLVSSFSYSEPFGHGSGSGTLNK